MNRCLPASGDMNKESRKSGWTLTRHSWLRMAVLVFFAGAFSAAATVAAAREPDPQAAYGPPSAPVVNMAITDDAPTSVGTASGTALSPAVASSSWVMAPLPEDEGGVAISATVASPVTASAMVAAAPR